MKPTTKKLCEILLDAGIIDIPMFDRALEVRKHWQKKIGQILLDLRYIDEVILTEALALQNNIPTINLDRIFIKESAISALTDDIIRKYRLLPFEVNQSRVKIAYSHASDVSLVTDFSHTIQYEVEMYLTTESQLRTYLEMYVPSQNKPTSEINWDSDEIAKQKGDVRKRIGEVVAAHDERKHFTQNFFCANQNREELQQDLTKLMQEVEIDFAWVQKLTTGDQASPLATVCNRARLLLKCLAGASTSQAVPHPQSAIESDGVARFANSSINQNTKRLVSELIDRNILKHQELKAWLKMAEQQHLSIPTLMVQKAAIDESQLSSIISEYCGIACLPPESAQASRETKYLFTPNVLKRFCFVPLQVNASGAVSLGVFHPLEDKLIRAIGQVLGLSLDFCMMTRSTIFTKIEMEFSPLYGPSAFKQEQKSILTLFSARVNSLAVLSLYSGAILPSTWGD